MEIYIKVKVLAQKLRYIILDFPLKNRQVTVHVHVTVGLVLQSFLVSTKKIAQ